MKQEMRKNLIRRIETGEEHFPGLSASRTRCCLTWRMPSSPARTSSSWARRTGEVPANPLADQPAGRRDPGHGRLRDQRQSLRSHLQALSRPHRRRGRGCGHRVGRRERRYGEKLATPDITIADLIGEVDPIKVAEGRYLSDELTIHYGLIPRHHRGIFCINELPDSAERIQVGLLNIMEERDVQIRGYRIRLPWTSSSWPPRTRGLHKPRPHNHSAQGPLRLPDPDSLPPEHGIRDCDHGAGALSLRRRDRAVGQRPAIHEGDRRGDHAACPPQPGHQPALRRLRPRHDRRLRVDACQRHAPGHPAERDGSGATRERPAFCAAGADREDRVRDRR